MQMSKRQSEQQGGVGAIVVGARAKASLPGEGGSSRTGTSAGRPSVSRTGNEVVALFSGCWPKDVIALHRSGFLVYWYRLDYEGKLLIESTRPT